MNTVLIAQYRMNMFTPTLWEMTCHRMIFRPFDVSI